MGLGDNHGVNLIDTAGLRDSRDEIERLGIERTHKELAQADVVLVVFDASHGKLPEDDAVMAALPRDGTRIHVLNKIDLPAVSGAVTAPEGVTQIRVSAKTGEGIDALRRQLLQSAGWQARGAEPGQ